MNYFKIFLVVFLAVFLALFTYNAIKNYYERRAIEQAFSDFTKTLRSPNSFTPKPKSTTVLTNPVTLPQQVTKPTGPQKLSEQQQICNFWKQAYSNKNTDHYFKRMQETCAGLD